MMCSLAFSIGVVVGALVIGWGVNLRLRRIVETLECASKSARAHALRADCELTRAEDAACATAWDCVAADVRRTFWGEAP